MLEVGKKYRFHWTSGKDVRWYSDYLDYKQLSGTYTITKIEGSIVYTKPTGNGNSNWDITFFEVFSAPVDKLYCDCPCSRTELRI